MQVVGLGGRENCVSKDRCYLSGGQNQNEFENNFWHQYGSQYNAGTSMRLTDVEI